MIMIKTKMRCKACGKLYMEIKVEGKAICDFKCKRCKTQNVQIITEKFN